MFRDFASIVKGDEVTVSGNCIITGKPVTMTVPLEAFKDYYERKKFAQDAFSMLTAGQREYFISGTSEEGWKQLFGKDEE